MANEDIAYFLKRAATEQALALSASHPSAAQAHFELASLYRARANSRSPLALVWTAAATPGAFDNSAASPQDNHHIWMTRRSRDTGE